MKKIYVIAFLLFLASKSYSQFAYSAANAAIVSGTYTDLGTNGTAITNSALGVPITTDDDVSGAQPIGFSFSYNSKSFTQFTLNTNGFIKLGADTSSATNIDPINSADTNLIYPYGRDLDGNATTEYRFYTSGVPGSQVCTIQYKKVKDYNAATGQYSAANFQIKLYEGSNVIEFVFGTYTASAAAPAFITTNLGIKGSTPASSVNATKASSIAWITATFIDGPYTGNTFNNRNNFLPVSGTTFRFTPIVLANADAEVSVLDTYGKLPLGYGTPHTITALVTNKGLTALNSVVVDLTIIGANPFVSSRTVSLPIGGSTLVTFDAYSPTIAGASDIAVTILPDDVNTNNVKTIYQTVTNNTFSYADTSGVKGAIGYNTGSGLLLARYIRSNINGGVANISGVNVFLSSATTNIGNMVYAVVLNSAGTIVAKSDSITIATADLGQYRTFLIPSGPLFNDTIYVGLAQKANAITGYFPVGYQNETPIKANAYFTAPIAGGVLPSSNSSIGRFMIEAVMSGTFPLNFLSFIGENKRNLVTLNWKTVNEINTKVFEIERSYGGSNFEKIGTVNAKSNPALVNEYTFKDENIASINTPSIYYRLRQIDNDGKFQFSKAIRIKLNGESKLVNIYPNPVKSTLNITMASLGEDLVTFAISDLSGKILIKQSRNVVSAESANYSLNVSNLAAGIYMLTVTGKRNAELTNTKFVKQ